MTLYEKQLNCVLILQCTIHSKSLQISLISITYLYLVAEEPFLVEHSAVLFRENNLFSLIWLTSDDVN